MADSEKNSQMPRKFLTRFTTTPKGQVTLVALSNGMNAASKAAFLAAATYLTTGEVFETFILMVVVIDAAAIVLDLGGSAGLIVTARDIPCDRQRAFYRRAQLFKLSYLIIAGLAFQFVWGVIPALLMIGVCLFEFQNTELQSNYRFLAQLARQATGFALRLLGLIPLFLYEVDKNLMLVLFYAPQFLIGLSFLFASVMNALNPRSTISDVLRTGFDENREIYRIGRSSLLMQIAVLILRRGDVAFVTYFLGAAVAAKVGLLFTFAQFLPMLSNAVSKVKGQDCHHNITRGRPRRRGAFILQDDPVTQHIRILFLGHGAAREGLMVRAADMNLTNVIFRASVPRDAVPGYWSLLDVALVHLRHTELFSTVIPSKMFECMGMGIPIILGVEGEAAEIIRQSGAGITIEPENFLQLAEQIKFLSGEPQLRKEMSSAGVAAAKTYDRTALARSMLAILQKVAYYNQID